MRPPLGEKLLWTLAETSGVVGFSTRHIQRLIDRGEFPQPKQRVPRGRLMFVPEVIRQYVRDLPGGVG